MNISPNIQAMLAIGLSRRIGANNVANMNTPEFQASRLTLETGPKWQGVHPQNIDRDASPGPMVPVLEEGVDEKGQRVTAWGMIKGGNTDLAMELVNSIQDVRAFKANVVMVRAWDEMTGMVLDLHA